MVSVEALLPSAILFLVMLGYGGLVTFLPIHATEQDVNPGLFFLVFALVVTAVRGYAGHLSDRFGRVAVAVGGLSLAGGAARPVWPARPPLLVPVRGARRGVRRPPRRDWNAVGNVEEPPDPRLRAPARRPRQRALEVANRQPDPRSP